MPQPPPTYDFETLAVQRNVEEPRVLEVMLNRHDKLNAMNTKLFVEMKECMQIASRDQDVTCVLIHGGGCRVFCAGLDLASEMNSGGVLDQGPQKTKATRDAARLSLRIEPGLVVGQDAISAVEKCLKPVVIAMHGGVIGGGIDLATASDIRYCTEDAFFSIAEVNIGLAADIGTLQRLPKIVGNDSVVRELALTGRRMGSAEAKELGLVGKVFPDRMRCLEEARATAKLVASKSPIAVIGTKVSLNYSRDHTTQEGLDHIRLWNSVHLQTEDVAVSVKATLKKEQPKYSRL